MEQANETGQAWEIEALLQTILPGQLGQTSVDIYMMKRWTR